jgi:hypothetical protein
MSVHGPNGGQASVEDRMTLLKRRANLIRARLLRAVDALDERGQQVKRIGARAKEVAKPAAWELAGIAVLFGASILAFSIAVKARRRRALSLPDRVSSALQRREQRPSLVVRILERSAMALASFVMTELAKRASHNLIDGRYPDGRLAVGKLLGARHAQLAGPQRGTP